MNHQLLIPRRRSGFSPLSFGSDLALWLDPSYGVYTDRSTLLAAASTQYWEITGLSAGGLHPGDTSWTIAGWFYAADVTATRGIASSTDGTNGYRVYTVSSTLTLDILSAGVSIGIVASGAISNNTWTFFVVQHDAATNKVKISLNGGAFVEAATSSAGTSASAFYVGSIAGVLPFDGRVDSLGFWNRLLTADEITSLRNAGAGKVYSDLTAGEVVSMAAWYEFDGDGLDAHGSNDLTAVNSPTYTSGIASGIAGDGDVESLVVPRTGSNGTPPSYAARPIWTASAGKPYHLFDGSNDSVSFGDVAAWDRGTGAFTLMFAAKGGDNADVAIAKDNYAGADNGILIARDTGAWGYWDGSALVSFGADSGAASIFTAVRSGTGSGQVAVRRNGVEITTGTDARTLSNSKALVFGDSADAGHTLNGRLGDVVFVTRALTAGELSQLEAWAAARQAA